MYELVLASVDRLRCAIDTVGLHNSILCSQVVKISIAELQMADMVRASGEDRAHVKLIDGVHRIRAVQSSGAHAIDAIFFDGDESQTSLLSVRLNSTHGLPRMLSDKKIAAQRILSDYLDWSNRRLAEVGYGENSSAGTMETI